MARYRLTIGGRLVGAQRWSFGISMPSESTAPGPADLSTFCTQAFTDFVTAAWSTTTTGTRKLSDLASTTANLDSVRLYFYPTGSSVATVVGASSNASVAGTGSATCPPQVAVVATLLTGLAGRSNRGRIYIPALGAAIGTTTGQLSGTQANDIAASVANWLSLLRTRSLPNGGFASAAVASATGPLKTITQVRVDSVLDTQRRRRDKVLAESTGTKNIIVA